MLYNLYLYKNGNLIKKGNTHIFREFLKANTELTEKQIKRIIKQEMSKRLTAFI